MKRLIPIVFVLVAACAGAQEPGAQLDAEIVALQARADALEALAHQLPQAALDTLQAQITTLQAQAHDLPQTELDALQAQVDAIFARLSALEMDRDDHEARISVLEGAGPPPGPVCGNNIIETGELCDGTALAGQTCTSQGFDSGTLACSADCLSFDTSACVIDPPPQPPPGGDLASAVWNSIPGSEMDTLYDPAIDPVSQWHFRAIQSAWSGGVCVGSEMVLWGGGHGDGANNSVLAIDVNTGQWRRVTQPSSLWQSADCPGGICTQPQPYGGTCEMMPDLAASYDCNVMPDGNPAARHTYNNLVTDGVDLYSFGGGIYKGGGVGVQPRNWKLDMATGTWAALADYNTTPSNPSLRVGDTVYNARVQWRMRTYTISTDTWSAEFNLGEYLNGGTHLKYSPTNGRIFALGQGRAWWAIPGDWSNAVDFYEAGHLLDSYVGIIYYPPEDVFVLWNGGQTIETLDPATLEWTMHDLTGVDPGPDLPNGPHGRFAYCDNKIVLINGSSSPLYYLDVGTPPPPAEDALLLELGVLDPGPYTPTDGWELTAAFNAEAGQGYTLSFTGDWGEGEMYVLFGGSSLGRVTSGDNTVVVPGNYASAGRNEITWRALFGGPYFDTSWQVSDLLIEDTQ